MVFKKINQILVVVSLLLILAWAQRAQAGFGISPPYVQNSNLTRNSFYEQKIWLGRSDPADELRVEVTVDVPGANDWISIDKGTSFIIPKGQKQIPMTVGVRVPDDAEFGTYEGNIRVRVFPTGPEKQGQVSIVLGAQIDVDLDVLDKKIYDFKVWTVNIPNLEEGHKFWWLYFPGKIQFVTEIENLGNIKSAPTKIELKVYDSKGEKILESMETEKIDTVNPFSTETITAEFPTYLPAGSYEAEFKVFKGEELSRGGKLHISILPYGTLPDYQGYGFEGLSLFHKITVIVLCLFAVIILVFAGYGIYRIWKKKRRRS